MKGHILSLQGNTKCLPNDWFLEKIRARKPEGLRGMSKCEKVPLVED